jgi:hypothetical protein
MSTSIRLLLEVTEDCKLIASIIGVLQAIQSPLSADHPSSGKIQKKSRPKKTKRKLDL